MNEQTTDRLNTPGDYAQAITSLVNEARLSVDVFSPDLTPVVFGGAEFIAAVRGFVLRHRHGVVRLLVRDSGPLTRGDHRFLELVQRTSSKIGVRVLTTDFHNREDAFVIADGARYAQRHDASGWTGVHDLSRPEVARQLLSAYNEMWEHSLPDPGVRRLHI